MADSEHLKIMDALVAISAAVTGIGNTGFLVEVGKMWNDEDKDKSAYLGDNGESIEGAPTRSMTSIASFFWHTIVKGNTPARRYEGLKQALRAGVEADPSLGGLAQLALVVGDEKLNTPANIAARTHVANIFVDVTYRTVRGTP